MKALNKISEYFLGTETIKYYNELSKKFPENIRQYKKERNKYILLGKIIPDIADLSGLVLICFNHPATGALLIGGAEGFRAEKVNDENFKKIEHLSYQIEKDIEAISANLKKK